MFIGLRMKKLNETFLMLNCKQVIELSSRSLDTTLPRWMKWQMKWHLLICKTCQRYLTHLRFIQKAAKTIDVHCQHIHLSEQARLRILEQIKR
jgi:transcription elongation factor Elf1